MELLYLQCLVLVFDEAIYSKVQQIRWKTPEFTERFAVRLGDFHATMSFLSTIGKRFREAGLEVYICLYCFHFSILE